MIKILISGIFGRLGQTLLECAQHTDGVCVAAGLDTAPAPADFSCPVYGTLDRVREEIDVIIDFSRPGALPGILNFAKARNCAVVLATTGYTDQDRKMIAEYAEFIPVFLAANMSLGVNLQMELIKKAAEVLGDDYDIEIVETHHNVKVDAPSGTALALADCLNSVFCGGKQYVYGRNPQSGRRNKKELGIHSLRGGTVVGEHDVLFLGNDEILKVSHSALSKQVFATGALRAAKYIYGKPPRLYCMSDIFAEATTLTSLYTDTAQAVITLTNIPAGTPFIAGLFEHLGSAGINVDIINQAPPEHGTIRLAFSVPKAEVARVREIADALFLEYPGVTLDVMNNITKLTMEGLGMEHQSGVAAQLFSCLSAHNIDVLLITTSETKILLCIEEKNTIAATSAIADAFSL